MRRSLTLSTVLVVEDVAETRLMLRQLLSRLGVTVIEAVDGAEGVDIARRQRPDLVLMDLSLPRMDGWQAIGELKASADTASIPIVVVTAHSSAQDIERARSMGCEGFVNKPLDVAGFARLVADLLLGEFVSPDARWACP